MAPKNLLIEVDTLVTSSKQNTDIYIRYRTVNARLSTIMKHTLAIVIFTEDVFTSYIDC